VKSKPLNIWIVTINKLLKICNKTKAFLIFLPFTLFHFYFLNKPIIGEMHDFRQAQTSLLTRSFIENGVNLESPMPIFGTNSNIPMEFPLFQILSAGISSILKVNSSISTRMLSIIFFQITAILTYFVAKRFLRKDIGFSFLLLFQATPFALVWGHSALIEWMPIAFILASVLCADMWAKQDSRINSILLVCLSCMFFITGFLVKVTTGIALTTLILVILAKSKNGKNLAEKSLKTKSLFIALTIILALAASEAWTNYSDGIKQSNRMTTFLTSNSQQNRILGSLSQRLSLSTWTHIFDDWGGIFGGATIILFLSIALILSKNERPFIFIIFLSSLVGPLVFTNLYYIHNYYSIVIYPCIVLLAAFLISKIEVFTVFKNNLFKSFVIFLIMGGAFFTSSGRGYAFSLLHPDRKTSEILKIKTNVPGTEGVLYLGCDWSPVWPYETNHPALMIPSIVGDAIDWKLKNIELENISHIYICDPNKDTKMIKIKSNLLPDGYSSFEEIAPGLYKIDKG
jgi:hypothetical protein